jgi:hypothetical protein
MARLDLLARPQPFIGLLVVVAGWLLSHQVGSDSGFDDCARLGSPFAVAVSLGGIVITGLGGLYCWKAWRTGRGGGRRFLGFIGAALALPLIFAMILQAAAGLILPSCVG